MAEGGAPLECESPHSRSERFVMLLIPEDNTPRRHSFHEVGHDPHCPKLYLEAKRRNSSYPETQFHSMCSPRISVNDDERILEIEDHVPVEIDHYRRHHKHHHQKRHSAAHKHHRRKSSARPGFEYVPKSKHTERKIEETPEQKSKRKIMMAVFVVTGFIVLVSVILVAVTLELSPKIDEMVRKENEDLMKMMAFPSSVPRKENVTTPTTISSAPPTPSG